MKKSDGRSTFGRDEQHYFERVALETVTCLATREPSATVRYLTGVNKRACPMRGAAVAPPPWQGTAVADNLFARAGPSTPPPHHRHHHGTMIFRPFSRRAAQRCVAVRPVSRACAHGRCAGTTSRALPTNIRVFRRDRVCYCLFFGRVRIWCCDLLLS